MSDVGPGEVAVKTTVAEEHGWTIGSIVPARSPERATCR